MFPLLLDEAITNGCWFDPGSDKLKYILRLNEDESDLVLFESREMMEKVSRDLDSGGYVDDPEFCMVRNKIEFNGPNDQRLVYTNALFVGGSKYPGDDVFLSIDVSIPSSKQMILWFDWSSMPPNRWKPIMPLSLFLEGLCKFRNDT
jgi:hypothetical protein